MKRVSEQQVEECRRLLAFLKGEISLKQYIMKEKKYQITGYQLVYENGQRDTVRLSMYINTDDIEEYRSFLLNTHRCKLVNLMYVTVEGES